MEKQKMTARAKEEARWGWMFILPTMLGLIILNFYPVFNTIYQSFCKTGDFGKGNVFVGLANYQKVIAAGETWQSLWNTVKYAIIEVPFGVCIALALAALLTGACLALLMLQKDLGTALLYFGMALMMMYVSTPPRALRSVSMPMTSPEALE